MGVNKVVYGGRTILDISDSTINPATVLSGAIGYGSDGERFVGTLTASDPFTKARILEIFLPKTGWVLDDSNAITNVEDSDYDEVLDSSSDPVLGRVFYDTERYIQRIQAPVTRRDHPFVQCVLSSDYETACDEIDAFSLITSVETFDGYIIVTFDTYGYLTECLECDMTLSLIILEGISEASIAEVQRAAGTTVVAELPASKWKNDGNIYSQTIDIDIPSDSVFIADGLFSLDLSLAIDEIQQLARVTDILISNGSLTAVCHCIDNQLPPSIDLQISLKVFKIKE